MVKSKKYLDYFKARDSDKLSSSALWFHIVNVVVTVVYILMGWAVFKMPEPNILDLALLTGVYAGIATGNKVANSILNYRYNKDIRAQEVNRLQSDTRTNKPKRRIVPNEDN